MSNSAYIIQTHAPTVQAPKRWVSTSYAINRADADRKIADLLKFNLGTKFRAILANGKHI